VRIDHLVVGSADLDRGIAWVRERIGVEPVFGGVHDGRGTRNALLGLGDQYLEVLALDPAQPPGDSAFSALVASMTEPALVTVCVRADRLDDGVVMSRERPDGVRLEWALRFTDTPLFFIDWRDSPHPSVGLPDGGRITSCRISTPDPASLAGVEDVTVVEGPWHVDASIDGVPLA
jgi:hypothetical protein